MGNIKSKRVVFRRPHSPKILSSLGRRGVLLAVVIVLIGYVGWQAVQLYGPPDIKIDSPVSDSHTNKGYTRLKGSVQTGVSINVNGSSLPLDEAGNFDVKVPLKVGANRLNIHAVNKLGRTNDIVRVVSYQP